MHRRGIGMLDKKEEMNMILQTDKQFNSDKQD